MPWDNCKSIKYTAKIILVSVTAITLLFTGCINNAAEAGDQEIKLSKDPAPGDYLFAKSMQIPGKTIEKVFIPSEKQANFTSSQGIDNLEVQDNKLVFTLTGDTASLGWGNCQGKQPIEEIISTFDQVNIPVIRVRQLGGGESEWTARLWRDGLRLPRGQSLKLIPGQWQELAFDKLYCPGPSPDGMDFSISSETGAKFEIESFKLQQTVYAGYVRSEFTIPEGKIWRAVANVIASNDRDITEQRDSNGIDRIASRFFLNGQLVKRRGAKHIEHLEPLDIVPYLRPGKNCVGFYGFRYSTSPLLYVQGRVIMESGEIIEITSGPEWSYNSEETADWSQPGFDDQVWQKVLPGRLPRIDERRLHDYNRQVGIPAYSGYLVIKNPTRKDLFYNDQEDLVVEVDIPAGLSGQQPELTYIFSKAGEKGSSIPLKQETVSTYASKDGSLKYQLNLGRHTHGVYTIEVVLKNANNEQIEARPREPLVVLRKLNPQIVEGKDFREGLELELEDSIDFTNPDDPHPWREGVMPVPMLNVVAEKITTPRIVEDGELKYREVTSLRRGSGFSYRIEFKHPGSFYYFELEYPDNARRIIEVLVSSKAVASKEGDVWSNCQSGVGAETGGKMMLTHEMKTLKWLHIADPGPHSIDIVNCLNSEPAVAAELRIYRVKNVLPAVAAHNTRNFGIMTERCFPTSGVGMNFGSGISISDGLIKQWDQGRSMLEIQVRDLAWLEQTCDNYLQYMKFCGQNLHIFGCYQYNEIYNPFIPVPLLDDSRARMCMKTILANLCDLNGIDIYAGIQFAQHREAQTFANNAQVAQGADTVCMVDSQGRQRYIYDPYSQVANWMHPVQRQKFRELISSLADTFGHLPHFRGLHNLVSPDRQSGYWPPAFGVGSQYDNPMSASFDDVSMAIFEEDTGLRLPIEKTDPRRFTKRAEFLSQPENKPAFLAWRGEKFVQLLTEALQILRQDRQDLEIINVPTLGDRKFFQNLEISGKSLTEKLKEFAIDLDAIKQVDGLWATRWTISWQHWYPKLPHRDPLFWKARTDPAYISAFDRDKSRSVFIRTSWDESFFMAGGYKLENESGGNELLMESDWIMNAQRVRVLPQPNTHYAREAHIQAIITADPEMIIGGWTDININTGHEQAIREVMLPFTHLPKEKFSSVLDTYLDTNLAIRVLQKETESFLYVANPGYWDITGQVTLHTNGKITAIPSGKEISAYSTETGINGITVDLKPYCFTAYRIDSPQIEVLKYETAPISQRAKAHMENIMNRVGDLLYEPKISQSLQPDERAYMDQNLKAAQTALAGGEYARTWYLLTQPQFWLLWEDFLEKGANNLALLPAEFPKTPAREEPKKIPEMNVRRLTLPVEIDGNLDEPAWAGKAFISDFYIFSKTRTSLMETGMQLAYDDQNLYLAFVCADPKTNELKATAKIENEIYASRDDILAFFIQPNVDETTYYQFAFNTAGTLFDQMVKGSERDYIFHPPWKVAVKINKGYWTAEVMMPFSSLGLEGPPEVMKTNLHRGIRSDIIEASSWSFITERDWHQPQRFGLLRFEK
ncbi:MAG: hypothetical protein JXA52_05355 [Planctomycetes bacterium]|nr:hypothetical protein [Planctomycetota bacterium]